MKDNQAHWNTYWLEHSTLNSFEYDYHDTQGPYHFVASYWEDIWSKITSNDCVVDLAAGKGALAKLAKDADIACKNFISVDNANKRLPFTHKAFSFEQANLEKLPFADRSINTMVSMFGVEYADLTDVFDEINRCLISDFYFVCHHYESVITQQSLCSHSIYDAFLNHENIKSFLATPNANINQAALLNQLKALLAKQDSQDAIDEVKILGNEIFKLLSSGASSAEVQINFRNWCESLTKTQVRLTAQIEAARRITDWIFDSQELENFEVSVHPMMAEKKLFAWIVNGKRVKNS